MSKKYRLIAVILVVFVVLSAVGTWVYIAYFSSPQYNNIDSVRESSDLSVILPTSLPKDSEITYHPTYDTTTGIISTIIEVDGTKVTFSQQKRPNTDIKQIDAADTFLVNAGSVYILKGEEGRLQAILETADSWVIVNADAGMGAEVFRATIESMGTIE